MTALAIIPARGGSKRIPRKNIRDFLGAPIISYAIRAAHTAGIFAEVMVSTDDEEIARVARQHGATVPFMRSTATAGDHATTLQVLREVLDNYRSAGRDFEFLCCLYPTAVLTHPETLQAGWNTLRERADAACVLPVVPYGYPVQRALRVRNGWLEMLHPEHAESRSQDLETTYHDAGQWYWLRTAALRDTGFQILGAASVPVVLDSLAAQDIDTDADWALAEAKFQLQQRKRPS